MTKSGYTHSVLKSMHKEAVLYLWWSLLLLGQTVALNGIQNILTVYPIYNDLEDSPVQRGITKLLSHIQMELKFEYIILWQSSKEKNCPLEGFIKDMSYEPLMTSSQDSRKSILSKKFSKLVLIMSCWQRLENIPSAELNETEYPFKTIHFVWLDNYKQMSIACQHIPDMVAFRHMFITKESLDRQLIYTCHHGQANEINFYDIRKQLQKEFYYMKDLPIITEADQLPPRSILYYDNKGQLQLEGFIGLCISSFAQRYNAELIITPPLTLQKVTHYEVLQNKTFAGLLDLPAVVVPLNPNISDEMFSCPLEIMEYCYMIPLPRLMETYTVFTYIIEVQVMIVIMILSFIYGALLTIGTRNNFNCLSLSSILLNDKSIRGLLGQSFVMPAKPSLFMQYVSFLVCYTSLIIATTYEAFLQSHLIHPTMERQVESYKDMRKAGLKIAINSRELNMLPPNTFNTHHDLFVKLRSFDDFVKLRDSLDTHYVFPVSNSRWQVFHHQQKYFERPLYFYSQNVCLSKVTLLSVPFRPNLPYKALFNQHVHDLRDTGLLQHWINNNFYAMVRYKYMRFDDISKPEQIADAIELKDYQWIWISYGALMLLSLMVFLVEVIFYLSKRYEQKIV